MTRFTDAGFRRVNPDKGPKQRGGRHDVNREIQQLGPGSGGHEYDQHRADRARQRAQKFARFLPSGKRP